MACGVTVAHACTTTNEINTDCADLTDATIGNAYDGAAGTAIGDWFANADTAAAEAKWGHIRDWYTGDVTTMYALFNDEDSFNEDIGGWVTSKVTTMEMMFGGASAFDQDISGWDTSKCTNMWGMFNGATAFDQDISPWCVALISSEPDFFGNAGTDPIWGTCDTPCTTGADGNECQNGGTAAGATPDDSTVLATCSCTCA
ncbi:hypothetical protein TeGR_g10049, partial [Tetraparma gracilis]